MNIFAYSRANERTSVKLESRLHASKIDLVDISHLKPHEEIDSAKLKDLKGCITEHGLMFPIVADKKTKIILDGHHRYNVFKKMKLAKIPVFYVDYSDNRIVVDSWSGKKITKQDVIDKVASGKVFPLKTTKHMFLSDDGPKHISSVLPSANVRISELAAKKAKRNERPSITMPLKLKGDQP